MIDSARLCTTFHQSAPHSCVLASYAVVSNYFTCLPITDFFEAYCRHYKIDIPSRSDAEHEYADHFYKECRDRECKGYQLIEHLHNTSDECEFRISRQRFTAEFYEETYPKIGEIKQKLTDKEALLNITIPVDEVNVHSLTVGYENGNLICVDTAEGKRCDVASISDLGDLRDGMLYVGSGVL